MHRKIFNKVGILLSQNVSENTYSPPFVFFLILFLDKKKRVKKADKPQEKTSKHFRHPLSNAIQYLTVMEDSLRHPVGANFR